MNRVLAIFLLAVSQAGMGATTCQFVTGGGVMFGPYNALSPTPADTALDLQVSCRRKGGQASVAVTVSLSSGANGTSATSRRMAGPTGDFLSYGLFSDPSRSVSWGFSPGVNTVSQTISIPNNSSASTTFRVYARIPARQDVSAGTYGDTVTVTLTP